MDNNPYDTPVEWANFYSQPTENVRSYEAAHPYPLTPSYQQEKIRPGPVVRRLSKQEAMERVRTLKGCIIVATLLGFGTLSGLVASQIFATTAGAGTNQIQATPVTQNPSEHDHHSWQSDSGSGGFFNQQGQGQGGYGFGQGNSSAPITGTHTS